MEYRLVTSTMLTAGRRRSCGGLLGLGLESADCVLRARQTNSSHGPRGWARASCEVGTGPSRVGVGRYRLVRDGALASRHWNGSR